MAQISEEVAKNDVLKWLDKQRVKPRVRAEKEDSIETLTQAICWGEAMINDNGDMVQILSFPIGETKELVYSSRITVEDIGVRTKGNAANDAFGIVSAYISASTGVSMGLLKKMDNSDMGIASAIVGFF